MRIFASITCLLVLASCVAAGIQQKNSRRLKPVQINGEWGYADETGKIVITPQFDEARPFSEGLAAVAFGNNSKPEEVNFLKLMGEYLKWGFINESGQVVIHPRFYNVGDFSEGLARVQVRGPHGRAKGLSGKWGFIDRKGKMVIESKYYQAEDFMNGRAYVWIGEVYIIGRRGSVVRTKFFGKYGYIDKSGKFRRSLTK